MSCQAQDRRDKEKLKRQKGQSGVSVSFDHVHVPSQTSCQRRLTCLAEDPLVLCLHRVGVPVCTETHVSHVPCPLCVQTWKTEAEMVLRQQYDS
jgi:hypothetical protein